MYPEITPNKELSGTHLQLSSGVIEDKKVFFFFFFSSQKEQRPQSSCRCTPRASIEAEPIACHGDVPTTTLETEASNPGSFFFFPVTAIEVSSAGRRPPREKRQVIVGSRLVMQMCARHNH